MKNKIKHYITVKNRKYSYFLSYSKKGITFVECKGANFAQEFLNEDIAALLKDLPELILSEQKYKKERDNLVQFRVNSDDKMKIEKKAMQHGYTTVSAFLRDLALNS